MKISVATYLWLAAAASNNSPVSGFTPQRPLHNKAMRSLAMSDETATATPPKEAATGGALVPIKDETVEFTAGLIGGVAGFAVGGPVLAAVGAAAANYVSKVDGEITDIIKAVSKSSIQIFNYLANLDAKYEILTKAKSSLQDSLDKLKAQESVDKATVEKVEQALANINKKIQEINDEYDLVGGGLTALGVFGDLIEKAINKAGELNEEYQLTTKAKNALATAVEKAKEAAKEATK